MRRGRLIGLLIGGVATLWACQDYVTGPGGTATREARAVQLDSAAFVLADGDTIRLAATVFDQNDSAFTALPAGVTLHWTTSAPNVATVDTGGLVTAVGPGTVEISAAVTADIGTFTASAAGAVLQVPTAVTAAVGTSQSGTVGAPAPDSLEARVLDGTGRGVPGVAVTFTAGGGSAVSAARVKTDSSGAARVAWTLGTRAGEDTVRASIAQLPDSVALFVATAAAGPPATMTKISGDGQSGPTGSTLAAPVVVQLTDQYGNAVAGNTIKWGVTAGGGSVTPTSGPTDSAGRAQADWTLGTTAGTNQITATATGSGITGNPVTFTATGGPVQTPVALVAAAGGGQSGTVGTALVDSLDARVLDGSGNGVPGVAVTFAVTGGALSATNVSTDSTGAAKVSWTLGTAAGSDTARATIAQLPDSVAVFTATALAGAPSTIAKVSGDAQSAHVGSNLSAPLVVSVTDQYGNPIAGDTVTWAVTVGGGTITPTSGQTDSAGQAQAQWTLGSTAGPDSATATARGVSGVIATFGAVGLVGTPASMVIAGGDAQTDTIDATLPLPLQIKVTDSSGAPVPGVPVTWGITLGGGSITPTSTTDTNGVASATMVLGSSVGAQHATGSVSSISGGLVTFAETSTAGHAAAMTAVSGNNQSGVPGATLPIAPTVNLADRLGDPVSGIGITFAVASGGGSATGTSQTTGVNGQAAVTSWTLGSAPGANTLTATAAGSGISGNPTTFTATGLAAATTRTWLGTASSDSTNWSDAANWSPSGVPSASDTVVISGSATNWPALTANAAVTLVRLSSGTLTLGGHVLSVSDSFTVSGSGIVVMTNANDSLVVGGTATFGGGDETGSLSAGVLAVSGDFMAPPATTSYDFNTSGTFKTVLIGNGPSAQTEYIVYAGQSHFQDLELRGTATLELSGGVVPVNGTLNVIGARTVHGTGTLVVAGDVTTGSGSTLNLINLQVGGALNVGGAYTVTSTNFDGTGQVVPPLPYIELDVTGAGATATGALAPNDSLRVLGTGTLVLGGRTTPGGPVEVTGALTLNGHTLVTGGSFATGSTGTITMTNASDSLIVHGQATFGGGSETGKLSAGVLTVDGNFVQPPANSANAFNTSGTFKTVLTGVASQSASMYYWGGNASHFQNLELAGTNALTLSGPIPVAGNLDVTGARSVTSTDTVMVTGNVTTALSSVLNLAGLEVGGTLTVGGTYVVGMTNFTGTGQTVPVLPYTNLAVTGPGATAAGPLTLGGGLGVLGAGTFTLTGRTTVAGVVMVTGGLTLGGQTLVCTGDLSTRSTGAITMISASDSLIAGSRALFVGGSETGKLSAGVLTVDSDFVQLPASSANAFNPSGTFKTVLTGVKTQMVHIAYASGNASHFQNLELAGGSALTFNGRIGVTGDLDVTGARVITGTDTVAVTGHVTTVSGSSLNLAGLDVAGAFSIGGTYVVGVTNFTGTKQVVPNDMELRKQYYQTLVISGPGGPPGGARPPPRWRRLRPRGGDGHRDHRLGHARDDDEHVYPG